MVGLRILAILAVRNEADVLGTVIEDLIGQGADVYLIDDGSSDGSDRIAASFMSRGVVAVERRATQRNGEKFEWADILRRKEAIASELDYDWFMHSDGDEFRESPWIGLTLSEGVSRVDRLGYNAIDFRVLTFRPTDNSFRSGSDVRLSLSCWEAASLWDQVQVKCWKRAARVDLASSGGHEAMFAGRKIFPVPFLTRHYPIRGQTHGHRKVFEDRKPRFLSTERDSGWHVQYDRMVDGHSFVADASTLREYDPLLVREDLLAAHSQPISEDEQPVRRALERWAERTLELAAQHHTLLAKLQAHRFGRDVPAVDRATGLSTTDRAECRRSEQIEAGLRHRLHEQSVELDVARSRTQALLSSRSWRLTGPVRWAYERLTRSGSREAVLVQGAPQPTSQVWGTDRGLPVDRYYIERFLQLHAADIKGRVLEVKDSGYSRRFGGDRLREVAVIDVDPGNSQATIVGDLARRETLPNRQFDCIVLTQTLHIVYEIEEALRNVTDLLAPGGTILCSIPAVSRVNYEDGGLESGDYWRLTAAAARELFAKSPRLREVSVETRGNVRVCSAFLYGLAAEELSETDLAFDDPWFPLIHGIRAVRAE